MSYQRGDIILVVFHPPTTGPQRETKARPINYLRLVSISKLLINTISKFENSASRFTIFPCRFVALPLSQFNKISKF
jgi:hypothetical protein